MDDGRGGRAKIGKCLNVRHHIMAQLLFRLFGRLKVNVVDLSFHFFNLSLLYRKTKVLKQNKDFGLNIIL